MARWSARVFLTVFCLWAFTQPAYGFPITFNSNVEQLLFSSADAPPPPLGFTPGDCPDCPFDITNNTGTTWTDFHFRLQLGPGSFGTFFFVDFVGGGYDGVVYEGPGTGAVVAGSFNQRLDVTGLNVPDGGFYSFSLDMDAFELLGTYELYGIPTTDGLPPPVPEPTSLALLGMVGVMGVRAGRRWMRRT